jgi:glyoxylase-like metal-dependent hydrolase (beta-lactamase superfamily II)
VVESLARDTGGRVDVLVVTHEHYDHVAALASPDELFCGQQSRQRGSCRSVRSGSAWTEDPGDPLGEN